MFRVRRGWMEGDYSGDKETDMERNEVQLGTNQLPEGCRKQGRQTFSSPLYFIKFLLYRAAPPSHL